jgi:iron(III) transport system permease protein
MAMIGTTAKRSKQLARLRATWDARHVIMAAGGGALILLVAYPMVLLVVKSLPLSNYVEQLGTSQTLIAIRNSFYIAVGATALAAVSGVTLAFLVVRTDLPFKKLISAAVYLVFLTPGYIGTVGWIQLLGRSGYLTRWLRTHLDLLRPPVNIYSLESVIVVMGLYFMPLIYMATSNALANADPSLEEAAIASGATPRQAVFTVTLPLAFPAVLSNALLVFVHGLSGFGIPAALAMPTGNMVLTTQIYAALGHYDVRKACATSVLLAVMLIAIMAAYNRLLRRNRVAVTASPDLHRHLLPLGAWKSAASAVVILFLGFVSLVPLITLLVTSLLKVYGLEATWGNLTVGNYVSIFSVGLGVRAMRNSFLFALAGATCATLLGFVIAYTTNRVQIRGRKVLDFLATLPSAIPGPVLAVAMIFAWMLPPFRLYNTPWIILVAYVAAFLPYAVRNISAGLKAANPQLEEMGWMSGGSWLTVLRDIVVPSARDSIWTGWLLVFLMAFREIPLSTMLYRDGTETVGVLLFLLKTESGGLEVVSAVAVVVMVLTTAGQLVIRRATNGGRLAEVAP